MHFRCPSHPTAHDLSHPLSVVPRICHGDRAGLVKDPRPFTAHGEGVTCFLTVAQPNPKE